MQARPIFLKLNLKATESHRISWNNQYFNLDGILIFEQKIETQEQAKQVCSQATVIFKLNPFKDEFKAKLLSHILMEDKEEKSQIIALTTKVNIFEKKILEILDIRQAEGVVNAYGNTPIDPDQTTPLQLTNDEHENLMRNLQKLIEGPMLPHLREPFIPYFPEFASENWQEKIPKNKDKATLVPFQALFPFSGGIERIYKDEAFILDDLYCTVPSCDCNEVNCLVITIDQDSGREVVFGGFKYQFEKKTFKNMQDFPSQFNAQEWFKQFNLNSAFHLPTLFEKRYRFLRQK